MKLGINASRARSGGAKAHLIGILSEGNPVVYGFTEVHVWSYLKLLESLPDQPWLVKHCLSETEASILRQMWRERFFLPKQLKEIGCDILFNIDAGTVCRFRPAVTMSQDMLAFEPGEAVRLGFSKAHLRQVALRYIQCRSLTRADASIFLTEYAAKIIQKACGQVRPFSVIPHGVGEKFRILSNRKPWTDNNGRKIRCLYVSNVAPYKHQWHVVRAIKLLRDQGFDLQLILTGGGEAAGASKAQALLEKELVLSDPEHTFVELIGFVPQHELPELLHKSDLFIFASSCENMPNTLLEAMASRLPIACSDRGPMPEILKDAGIYFIPENSASIAQAVKKIITDTELRFAIAQKAQELSNQYSWARCADETFGFLSKIVKEYYSKDLS